MAGNTNWTPQLEDLFELDAQLTDEQRMVKESASIRSGQTGPACERSLSQ